LVGAAEAEEIRRHHAAARGEEMRDHAPIEIAPGRLPVEAEKHRRTGRTVVNIRHRQSGMKPPKFTPGPRTQYVATSPCHFGRRVRPTLTTGCLVRATRVNVQGRR